MSDDENAARAEIEQAYPGCMIRLEQISAGWFCRLSPITCLAKCDPVALEPTPGEALRAALAKLLAPKPEVWLNRP